MQGLPLRKAMLNAGPWNVASFENYFATSTSAIKLAYSFTILDNGLYLKWLKPDVDAY